MTADRSCALVSVRGLAKRFVQKRACSSVKFTIEALRGVDLAIERGTTLALVGESGAGKSTLVRCLCLLEKPTDGQIVFDGVDLCALRRKALLPFRRQIQLIFQDPASSLNPAMTAEQIVAEPLAIVHRGTKTERRRRALELMERVGLPAAAAAKLPLEFSGGQRQRLAIARALALRPKLLVLDEALSGLDLGTQGSIRQLLRELQSCHGLTYLQVSHDLRMVADWAEEVAVMHEGRIVERQRAKDLFTRPEHPYTRGLLDAIEPGELFSPETLAEAAR